MVTCARAPSGIETLTEKRYDVFIDARGLNCPMPLIKTRQALMVTSPGATICVLATDPASSRDFEMFSEATGHRILSADRDGDVFIFVIEKVDPALADPLDP